MPQLRQDPVTGRWVAIATERAKRPSSFTRAPSVAVPATAQCPFCYGHEAMTPPEVMAYRPADTLPDTPGWLVRIVPNLYPAFGPANGEPTVTSDGLYTAMNGVGIHEVIVTSPDHQHDLAELTVETVDRVVTAWMDRMRAHRSNPAIQYLLLINNHGKEAGASLEHPHAQLFGIPVVPSALVEELEGIARYRRAHRRCVYCDVIAREIAEGKRVIVENDRFLVFAPYASRTPFEVQVIPKQHAALFEATPAEERRAFAEALHQALGRISRGLNNPPFNFYVHTAPVHAGPAVDYHWHLEVLPRLAIAAGFEQGSGVMINVATPEAAAEFLRAVPAAEPEPALAPGIH